MVEARTISMAVKASVAIFLVTSLAGCGDAKPDVHSSELPPTLANYGELMVECLGEHGFEAEAQGTGLTAQIKPDQMDAYQRASDECEKQYGYDAMITLTDDQLSEMYQLELGVKACLESLGYTIELPSEQSYIDNYYLAPEEGGFLLPHTQAMQQAGSRADVEEADTTCKQAPALYNGPFLGPSR